MPTSFGLRRRKSSSNPWRSTLGIAIFSFLPPRASAVAARVSTKVIVNSLTRRLSRLPVLISINTGCSIQGEVSILRISADTRAFDCVTPLQRNGVALLLHGTQENPFRNLFCQLIQQMNRFRTIPCSASMICFLDSSAAVCSLSRLISSSCLSRTAISLQEVVPFILGRYVAADDGVNKEHDQTGEYRDERSQHKNCCRRSLRFCSRCGRRLMRIIRRTSAWPGRKPPSVMRRQQAGCGPSPDPTTPCRQTGWRRRY